MSASFVLFKGGRLIDPTSGVDAVTDVRIGNGRIETIADGIVPRGDERVIQADRFIITPGWIDAHVHLRDPGLTHKEDLASGAAAALAGGFTRVCCMPNTEPALDTPERVWDIVNRGRATGVHIHPIGAISVGRAGEELAPLSDMAAAGAIGFSDDGVSTRSQDVMRDALRWSTELNLPIMAHCEDPCMAAGGSMHRGVVSGELGDPGIPAEAEESYIERDLELAAETGGWLHVLHVSTDRGARLIADAKRRGVRVTAEVMPHHLTLTDEWVAGRRCFAGERQVVAEVGLDSNAKVNPPLRRAADALLLLERLRAGLFDFIATDHAPHAPSDKPRELATAAFGMSGLELAIPLMVRLLERGELDWTLVVDHFTARPARTLGLDGGRIAVGDVADITVIDPHREWLIEPAALRTRSANTPLLGLTMRGRAVMTMTGGMARHDELS